MKRIRPNERMITQGSGGTQSLQRRIGNERDPFRVQAWPPARG
jgi:hypothetical protein